MSVENEETASGTDDVAKGVAGTTTNYTTGGTGFEQEGDSGSGDEGSDNGSGDNGSGDNGSGDNGSGDNGSGDSGSEGGPPKSGGPVDGTAADDVMLPGYVDAQGDTIDGADGDNDIIYAYEGDDSVDAGAGDDLVYGGAGADTLAGGAGDNDLYGGSGRDVFVGGAGADDFYGGADQDNLDYSNSDAGVTVDLTMNTLAGGDADNDRIMGGIDGAIGSEYDDVLVGFDQSSTDPLDTYSNEFFGGGGDDSISGLGGDDLLDGGTGADTISGGDGNDQITGGEGSDEMSGGGGRDTFVIGSAADGSGDVVDGGSDGDDFDTLDLTGVGSYRIIDETTDADGNSTSGTVQFLDAPDGSVTGEMRFSEIERIVPCFTPGTMIVTSRGEKPVETLQVGDKVITRDNGAQEIRWIGTKVMSGLELRANPHLQPVLIRQGALGRGLPERDMLVSPNHRLLISNSDVNLYFNQSEVLVPAKHLLDSGIGVQTVCETGTSYIHFMFDNHEVVLSDGAWTESFQPGELALNGIAEDQRSEIFDLFPELEQPKGREAYGAARVSLKKHEARLLFK